MVFRRFLIWLAVVLAYAVTFRVIAFAMDYLDVGGGGRLLALAGYHAVFGVIGYFIFSGSPLLRAVLVFSAVLGHGIVMDVLMPMRGQSYVQVFTNLAFGLLAAACTRWFGRLLEKTFARRKPE